MSIAPPAQPAWPPPPPLQRLRRWPAIAAAAGVGAVIAGVITTLVTIAATPRVANNSTPAQAPTVTVTAAPPAPTAPLPAAEADKKTCQAWAITDDLVTTAASGLNVIPQNMPFTDPAVQANPTWKAAVDRASQLYGQAAETLAGQIAPGTSPMLAGFADSTVSALRTLAVAYKTFDPTSGKVVDMFTAGRDSLDWVCGR
ncbi:hypothetical protein AWC29_01090 [Mycobacterium triplex]|jgi:hypothetical protein|uniref:Alanine and proline rich membrane protein n=3 Tax=Mycobacterium TaxID=1763 RepID=A0A024K6N9_9MYCO|nr:MULTISPECIES: hypothetical protein [Mycobacterium]MCA2272525.1 hypothetical protein [Mycobacterium intracellulare]MCA2324736.1 hypothetical protein [Mycobacterium intracellulare]OBH48410.1 hypothetical protein A5690_14705 [Mycobacterium intracellulare]ORA14435.1 hypothetical protein BST14_13905 [Mycobacterium arosiense ATCC BAA-1401 = DSM 45069]ORJ52503.1 hypothetical protein B5M45_31325 [Mycobacterium simiae]